MLPKDIFNFVIMDLEGGSAISDAATDPGGLTKYGISQKAYPTLDIRSLTEEDARSIYDGTYWAGIRGDDLPGPIALVAFDCAVNQGVATAIKLLQRALGVPQDGIIGQVTIMAARNTDMRKVVEQLAILRLRRYLSMDNSVEEANERGWGTRLIRVVCKALSR